MVVNAPRKLLRWAYLILIGWATLVSVLITGYMGDQGFTHNFSLILVHRLNDAELYPNDPFAETAYSYASVYWYIVAWLNRWFALEWILGVFLLRHKSRWLLQLIKSRRLCSRVARVHRWQR